MKTILKNTLCAALFAGYVSAPVFAQFSAPLPSSVAETDSATGGKAATNSIGLYPYTSIEAGSAVTINGKTYGARGTANGLLVVGEHLFPSAKGAGSVALGGWYWRENTRTDLYALQARYNFASPVSIQLNSLASTHGGSRDYSLLGLYTFGKSPASLQVGFGPYFPANDDLGGGVTIKNGAGYTALVQGSVSVGENLSLNASYWYLHYSGHARLGGVEVPGVQVHPHFGRFAAGMGYKF